MTPKSGILTIDDIKSIGIIEHFDAFCFQHASYDLRLGVEYLVAIQYDTNLKQAPVTNISKCEVGDFIVIPPFTSVILSSYELIKLPGNVAGRFDLKIKPALMGLMVQMGTQVEPWYHGRLFALVHNVSDKPRSFRCGDSKASIFNIEFHFTSALTKQPAKYSDGKTYEKLNTFLSEMVIGNSLNGLLIEINKIKEEIDTTNKEVRNWSIGKRSLFAAIIIGIASIIFSIVFPQILDKWVYGRDVYPLSNYGQFKQLLSEGNNSSQYQNNVSILLNDYLSQQTVYDSLLNNIKDTNNIVLRIHKDRLNRTYNLLIKLGK